MSLCAFLRPDAPEPSHVEVVLAPEAATFDPEKFRRYWTTAMVVKDRDGRVHRNVRYCVELRRVQYEGQDPMLIGSSRDGASSYQRPVEMIEEREKNGVIERTKSTVYEKFPGTDGFPHPYRGHVIAVVLPRKINGEWESEVREAGQATRPEDGVSDP